MSPSKLVVDRIDRRVADLDRTLILSLLPFPFPYLSESLPWDRRTKKSFCSATSAAAQAALDVSRSKYRIVVSSA